MILKGSQRSGGKQLGLHLLKTEENEHVEIHEVSGFVSDTVMGAMNEAYAASRGTRCKQYLFSLSLSPPAHESVRIEVFEKALADVEERLGLTGQPRIIVFHEKEGRRHCHAVWSRIDAETMKAKELPHFGLKLKSLAKQIFLENGWNMPRGYESARLRDPRSFSLDEWQKAKRADIDPRELKAAVNDCWKRADSAKAFAAALEERGLFLARGDRRAFVVTTLDGDVFAISRMIPEKVKVIEERLGDPARLPSVAETQQRIATDIAPRLKYRFEGKENKLALGRYPEVSLKEARRRRDEARQALVNGIDPAEKKKQKAAEAARNAANSFAAVGSEYLDKMARDGREAVTINKSRWLLGLFSDDVSNHPVADIKPAELLKALQVIESKGHHETARRMRSAARESAQRPPHLSM